MNKRGSALLIVLGMLSFMIVSAVSFSIFMRQGRAPSSYFRKSVAHRHLLNAALARAIDEIDTAIGNDPFPGIGNNANRGDDSSDRWIGRVLAPYANYAEIQQDIDASEIDDKRIWNTTVSTLTAEALGYLPPCLINEVRLYSRLTTNATWKTFNYDQGRYAFSAVNVSDFFDVNRLQKNPNRSSSPEGRVSLATLFADTANSIEPNISQLQDYHESIADRSISIPEMPFVSLLDYNLAIGSVAQPGHRTPFYNYFKNQLGNTSIYSGLGEAEVARQAFIVDSYSMETNAANYVDLSKPDHQPFYTLANFPGPETGSQLSLNDVFNLTASLKFWKNDTDFVRGTERMRVEENFPILTQILLADYLDCDHIPLSLNLPCTEIAPMVVGIECNPKFNMKFSQSASSSASFYANPGDPAPSIHNSTFDVDIDAEPEITVDVAFPFNDVSRKLSNRNLEYKMQVVARLFFTPVSDNTLRMPRTTGFNLDFLKDADVAAQNSSIVWPTGDEINDYSILWGSTDVTFTAPDDNQINNMQAYLRTVNVRLRRQTTGVRSLFNVWYTMPYALISPGTPYYNSGVAAPAGQTQPPSYPAPSFRFLNYNSGVLSLLDPDQLPGVKIRPSLAVWVRIVDPNDSDKVVDMVPATIKCDMWNNPGMSMAQFQSVFSQYEHYAGSDFVNLEVPFLRYWGDSSTEFEFTLNDVCQKAVASYTIGMPVFTPASYLAGDPRYNWAPEDWYEGAPGKWLDNVRGMFGTNGRDDFFMSVSDQGYLQSVYELMFIPRARDLVSNAGPSFGFLDKNGGRSHSYNGALRPALAQTSHYDMMWRTYRQGQTSAQGIVVNSTQGWRGEDDLSRLRISSGDKGMRVNPYTDMTNLFMGVFANMPMDWWAAGTNWHTTGKAYMNPDRANFDQSNLFDYRNILNYDNVLDISSFMMNEFRQNVRNGDPDIWKTIFDEFSWGGANSADDPLDIIKDDITLNDRKFIYGYTRECFANKQQLFLVFLRVESVVMGGKGDGQLGARAVALVWRDPRPASNNDNSDIYLDNPQRDWRKDRRDGTRPHRTRVLFFHQFD